MRHGVKNNHLGRKTPHRKALLRNLACQLIQHKRIITTLAKAKALRIFVEPILTKSKTDDTHQRRVVFSYLQDKEAIKELFGTVSMKIGDRPGGYCRIIKLERRLGDAADMALIELVDFNETYNPNTVVGEEKKKTRRSRVKKSAAPAAAAPKLFDDAAAPAPEAAAPVAEVEAAVEEVAAPAVEAVAQPIAETVAEPAAVETTEAPASADAQVAGDDLKIIEGIGPKIAELCNGIGIFTFQQLADAPLETLQKMLEDAGSRYAVHNPTTWSAQAKMAAEGKMDELKAWQDELKGGQEAE